MTELPDAQPTPDIQAAFAPLAQLPCWNVRVGYASNLSMEFGNPQLEISQDRPRRERERPPRHIHVKGEWYLWIRALNWYVLQDGRLKGGIHTEKAQNRAVNLLAGRKLERVVINTLPGRTVFFFEDSVQVCTRPYKRQGFDDEQWLLYQPSGMVWTLYADGSLEYTDDKTPFIRSSR